MQSILANGGSVALPPALARAANVVDLLVERAKADRQGAFWPIPPSFRQWPAAQVECTLGAGTAGIVLALAEYYRVTQDSTIGELVGKANSWLNFRMCARDFGPGFYFGHGGWWHMQSVLRDVLPGIDQDGADRLAAALNKVAVAPPKESFASLTDGFAGTLVAALSAQSPDGGINLVDLRALVDVLVQRARLSPVGVFWDFHPDAVKAPNGFLNGSAGVDYALAGARIHLGSSFPELVTSSVGHANAAFDSLTMNWPDFEGSELLTKLDQESLVKIVQRSMDGLDSEGMRTGNCIGWGTGATGILLSRALVAEAFPGHPLAQTCLADCRRVVDRLEHTTDEEWVGLGPNLKNGIGGIALAMMAYEATGAAKTHPLRAAFQRRLRAAMEERGAKVGTDDLSLLTGASGAAYGWLKLASSAPEASCLNPLAFAPKAVAPNLEAEENLQGLIAHRLPRVSVILDRGARLGAAGISLASVEGATAKYRAKHADSEAVKAANYELELHRQLAQIPSFRSLLLREGYKRLMYARSYGEGMDDALLMQRFKLDQNVSLLELEFDPSDLAPDIRPQRASLVRYRCSRGIMDGKLSMLQKALLEQFQTPAIVIEVISRVIERVQTPNVTQKQLATLSLKIIRTYVADGYLFPATLGVIHAALLRRRWRSVRMNLFPAGASS